MIQYTSLEFWCIHPKLDTSTYWMDPKCVIKDIIQHQPQNSYLYVDIKLFIRSGWKLENAKHLNNMKEEVERDYYKNGRICRETPHKNGKIHGLYKHWNSNGQISWETPYINGLIHGLSKGWSFNEQIYYKIPHKNDLQHGAMIKVQYWNNFMKFSL